VRTTSADPVRVAVLRRRLADPWVNDLVEGGLRVAESDGCFPVPTAPGLGVRLDHAAVAQHPRTRVHFNLMQEGWERRGLPPEPD
jgi:galactonate dehydratase